MSDIIHNLVTANLLHPRFPDVCWVRDEPMPGSFPAPPHFIRERLWERVCYGQQASGVTDDVRTTF